MEAVRGMVWIFSGIAHSLGIVFFLILLFNLEQVSLLFTFNLFYDLFTFTCISSAAGEIFMCSVESCMYCV